MSDLLGLDGWGDEDPIRVLLCDDHALFRRGLVMVLEEESDIEVLAEAAGGQEAVSAAEDLAPDVVLMDVRMPGLGGITATRLIRRAVPSARVLMLTVSDDEDDLFDSIKAGACGYLLKEISLDELADAVRDVMAGHSIMPSSMAAKLVAEFDGIEQVAGDGSVAPALTPRELELLQRTADGLTVPDLAGRLGLSPSTVRNALRNVLEKLHLHAKLDDAVDHRRQQLVESAS